MDATQACDESILRAMRVMAPWGGGHVVEEADALFVVGKGRFPSPYTNAVFPRRNVDPVALLARAEAVFADRRYVVWSHDVGGPLARLALSRGYASFKDLPGMVIDARVAPPPATVSAAMVRSHTDFADFVRVQGESFAELGLPPTITNALLGSGDAALGTAAFALGRVGGVPAGGALAITDRSTGVGGLYWVGTTPLARRRGLAEALTRLVTNASFDDGATVVTLQASVAGEPVYRRIGYREVCRYDRFLSPGRT